MIPVLNNQDDSWKVSATPFFFVVHVRMTNFPTWNVVQEQKFSWTSSHTFRKGVFGIFLGGANTFRVCSKGLEFWVPRPNKKWLKNVGSRWIMMFFTDSKHCGLVLKPDLEDQKHPVDEKLKHEFRISIHSSMLGESASPPKNLRREATSSSDGFNHLLLVLPWACVSKFWLFSASTTARKINMEPENTLLHGNPKPWNLKVLHPQYMGYNP